MSSAHNAHDAFDGEPVMALGPGEPSTPGWLPLVGLAFFAVMGVILLAGSEAPAVAGDASATAKPGVSAVEPPPPAPEGATGGAAVRKLTPQQVEELKRRIDDARNQGAPKNLIQR